MMKLKKGMKLFSVEKEIVFIIKEFLGYCGRGDKCINCKGEMKLRTQRKKYGTNNWWTTIICKSVIEWAIKNDKYKILNNSSIRRL